jgi:ADP-heptose:LPS heptosyltransferase
MQLKRLELWWRRLWITLLVRLLRRRTAPIPDWRTGQHRVLFLRHDRAGDMILTTAALREIARSHPGVRLDVLASPVNAAILEQLPDVNRVVVFDRRRLAGYLAAARQLRAGRYDAVIDCMVSAPSLTTLLLMWATGAPVRVGIAGRGSDEAMTLTVPRAPARSHMVAEIGALAAAFGVDTSRADWHPVLALAPAERQWSDAQWGAGGRRILVNVSAGIPARKWAPDRYAAVIEHLQSLDPNAAIRIIGAPTESDRMAQVAAATGTVALRTPGIRQAFALVATAELVITPDTSIAHAASAFQRPVVAMYLPGVAFQWGPYGTECQVVEHDQATFATLEVAPVIAAVDALWQRVIAREPADLATIGG